MTTGMSRESYGTCLGIGKLHTVITTGQLFDLIARIKITEQLDLDPFVGQNLSFSLSSH